MQACMALVMLCVTPAVAGDAPANAGSAIVNDPVLARAGKLAEAGKFAEAAGVLSDRADNPDADAVARREIQAEILRRIRLDYNLTEERMLAKLRKAVPDASADDLKRWRETRQIQFREIDGALWYFNREPSNLFRRSKEARERRDRADGGAAARKAAEQDAALVRKLTEIVAAAEKSDATHFAPQRHRATVTITLSPAHHRLKAGSLVRIWMVYPQEYRQQKEVRFVSSTPPASVITPNWDMAGDGEFQRALYFEQQVQDPAKPVRAQAVYEWTTCAYYPRLDAARARPPKTDSSVYREFTAERPPHIAFTPEVKAIVEKETAGVTNPLERARRLWLWTDRNIRYAYEAEYSTIPSLSAKAIRTREGDCGVQGMTFITLCRAAGVPARWQSGWETKPWGYTMHDWAEFYVEPWGWLPADPSYGQQTSDDPRVREFFFGHMDPYRCIVNLDYGCPLVPAKKTFRSEPIDFQRGEVEVDGENWYYDEWDCTFKVEWPEP